MQTVALSIAKIELSNEESCEECFTQLETDLFGNNVSILVSTYYIPADKVAISPFQERM